MTKTPIKHLDSSAIRMAETVDASAPEGERKTVTALFADIRGSTELMEEIDPEEARASIDPALKLSIRTGQTQSEYTPIGHTTNLASRLQAVARTGSVVVSENTRKLTEGYFQFRSLGGVRVKGIAEPINVHELTGLGALRTRLQRAVDRGLTRFVGPVREL